MTTELTFEKTHMQSSAGLVAILKSQLAFTFTVTTELNRRVCWWCDLRRISIVQGGKDVLDAISRMSLLYWLWLQNWTGEYAGDVFSDPQDTNHDSCVLYLTHWYETWQIHKRRGKVCWFWVLRLLSMVQGVEDAQDASSRRSLFAKEPLIIGLFCVKWRIKKRHPMDLRHPVNWVPHTSRAEDRQLACTFDVQPIAFGVSFLQSQNWIEYLVLYISSNI